MNELRERIASWVRSVAPRLAPYSKYASMIGYPLFYVLCLVIFAALTFPYERLRDRIVAAFDADQRASGGTHELQIEHMSGYGLTGVRMTGVTLLGAPAEPGKPPTKLVIDEAVVRYEIFPLLFGGTDLDFDVDAFGGNGRGEYVEHGKDKVVDATIDDFDLAQVGPLLALLGVPVQGRLGGTIRLTLPDGKASKAGGSIALESKGTAIGDGKAKIKDTLALPKIDVGTLTIDAEAKDGALRITKFLAAGKDLDIQGEGRITLRENVGDSLCDLQIRFRINDAYRSKNDVTKSLFGAPGSTAPALFELADPKIKQAKRPDGYYGWRVTGPLSRLDFLPSSR